MDSELQSQVNQWLAWDRNETTRNEVNALVAAEDFTKLHAIMNTRMEFGTAGLRAAMGAGFARMNELCILQTAQGLRKYLQTTIPANDLQSKGIIIGYDARHNSDRFAEITANVMLAAKIPTKLFRQIVPTPYVPFGLKHFGCVAGVMVTASHNPKQDNGYKVYWTNGAQLVPPHDKGIADAILECLEPEESSWTHQEGSEDPFDEITAEYYASLKSEIRIPEAKEAFKFVYTAMHGVGTEFTKKSLETFGVASDCVYLVDEQCSPDPEFPTVAFPNPEEGKSSLDLSFKRADSVGATVILANDPDADRLAVAEKDASGSWKVFNGNQIGALLGWWQLHWHKKQCGLDTSVYMVASAVSSKILASMAKKEGFSFEETLTGFKWMGSKAETLGKEGKKVIFAFEEAIGFMIGDRVFDKDGVTAAGVLAEMAWCLGKEGKTLQDKLQEIFADYGFHQTYNSYVISSDSQKTKKMFDSMRTLDNGGYPTKIAGVDVVSVRDLSVGFDSSKDDKKAILPCSAVSPMITFTLANGVSLTIRGSGTEPKIKWYSEEITATASDEASFVKFIDAAVEQLMRPTEFGFKKRPTA